MEQFDVIVVGARCAGSPLAALLARSGVRVAVVEQATFPRDTLSTHFIQAQALAFLDRLGVMEKIRATGAPLVGHFDVRQEKRLLEQGKIDAVIDLFTHRSHPSQVITPPRLLGATGRLLLRPGCQRRNLLREVGALIRTDVHRKRLNRRPAYVAAAACTDAGPTEVQDSALR